MNRIGYIFGLATLVLATTGVRAEEPALLKLVQRIDLPDVEGRIDHLACDVGSRRLIVAALGNNTVEVIDLAGGKRMSQVRDVAKPQGIAVVGGAGSIAVASGGDGKLRLVDGEGKLSGVLSDLADADNVRYDAKGDRLYVGFGEGAIGIVNARTFQKLGEIKLPGHPESFQIETRGPRLFANVPDAGEVAVIDREKESVVAHWAVTGAKANFPMALDEAHGRLFIVCRDPAELMVYDTKAGKEVASCRCVGDADDVFCDAQRHRLYITGGQGAISVVEQADADGYRVIGEVATAAGARTSLFVPQMDRLYVAVPHRGSQKAQIQVYEPSSAKP